jgi:hypothetical protein
MKRVIGRLLVFSLIFVFWGCTKNEEPPPQIDKSLYQLVEDMWELKAELGGGYVYNNPDGYWVIEASIGKGYQADDDLKRPIEGVYWYKAEKASNSVYFYYPSKYKVKEGICKIYFHGKNGMYYLADLIEESK